MSDVRLIDANALPNYKCQVTATIGDWKGPAEMRFVFWQDIEKAPTIDAVEVVHGRWVETGKVFVHSMYDLFTKCSLCSFGHVRNEYQEPYRFCPNCGAKMDGDERES